jgi:hypothetical protein
VSLQELRRHTAQGTILFAAAERVIAGPQRYTAAEVADLAGVEVKVSPRGPPRDGTARARPG